jgi:hypothetical protein
MSTGSARSSDRRQRCCRWSASFRYSALLTSASVNACGVFLILLAEIDALHDHLGGRGYMLVLASFVAIYGVAHGAHVIPRPRGAEGEESFLLWVRAAMLWSFGFLFLLTIPEMVEADVALYLLTLTVGALAVAFKSYEVSVGLYVGVFLARAAVLG